MERRFTIEAEIEILKHEVSVLKALCADLRKTMKAQDDMKDEERAKRLALARKTKTVESQEKETCEKRKGGEPHSWAKKSKSCNRCLMWWEQCVFCGEEKLNSCVSCS
jgi:hypothetical protein